MFSVSGSSVGIMNSIEQQIGLLIVPSITIASGMYLKVTITDTLVSIIPGSVFLDSSILPLDPT